MLEKGVSTHQSLILGSGNFHQWTLSIVLSQRDNNIYKIKFLKGISPPPPQLYGTWFLSNPFIRILFYTRIVSKFLTLNHKSSYRLQKEHHSWRMMLGRRPWLFVMLLWSHNSIPRSSQEAHSQKLSHPFVLFSCKSQFHQPRTKFLIIQTPPIL